MMYINALQNVFVVFNEAVSTEWLFINPKCETRCSYALHLNTLFIHNYDYISKLENNSAIMQKYWKIQCRAATCVKPLISPKGKEQATMVSQ